MRIKSKPQDFRVWELLKDGYVGEAGKFRIYRVTKKKLTTLEAATELATSTGVKSSEIGLAGMKDRQGVTTQFMSVRGGRPVRFQSPSLKVETVGFAKHALSSKDSIGNGFEIALRGVSPEEHSEIQREIPSVREHGVPNYFGEQRFGNLRHGQGWVAKDLALGRAEDALKNLLASPSENDNPKNRSFKRGLISAWGEWKRCRDVAGAFGQHHSIFEHLAREPDDFAGAFRYVKTEVRLIHLYAFQSHIWNRAVARFVGETAKRGDKVLVPSLEGPVAFSRGALAIPETWKGTFRMPGEALHDVEHDDQRKWLTAALAAEGLTPEQFRIHGVAGFAIKGEDRQLVVHPRGLELVVDRRVRGVLHLRFDLPRGAYATLVLARLAPSRAADTPDDARRRANAEAMSGTAADPRGDDRPNRRPAYGRDESHEPRAATPQRRPYLPRGSNAERPAAPSRFPEPRGPERRGPAPRGPAPRGPAPRAPAPRGAPPRGAASRGAGPRGAGPRGAAAGGAAAGGAAARAPRPRRDDAGPKKTPRSDR